MIWTRAWSEVVSCWKTDRKVCHCATLLSAHIKTTISPGKMFTVPGISGIWRLLDITEIWSWPTPDRHITACLHCQGIRETSGCAVQIFLKQSYDIYNVTKDTIITIFYYLLAAGNRDARQLSETAWGFIKTGITLIKSFTTHSESTLLISLKVRAHFLSLSKKEQDRGQRKTKTLLFILQESPSLTPQVVIHCCFSQCHLEKLQVQRH